MKMPFLCMRGKYNNHCYYFRLACLCSIGGLRPCVTNPRGKQDKPTMWGSRGVGSQEQPSPLWSFILLSSWWLRIVKGLKFSLFLNYHETCDSWVGDKEVYYSWNSRQHELLCSHWFSLSPSTHGDNVHAVGLGHIRVTLKLGDSNRL